MPFKSPKKIDDTYFTSNFNTQLNKVDEKAFQGWVKLQSRLRGRDMMKDLTNYDLAGYWAKGGFTNLSPTGHFPDTFKKPNHPTFSNESMYHGTEGPDGPWEGGSWKGEQFTPSAKQLKRFKR